MEQIKNKKWIQTDFSLPRQSFSPNHLEHLVFSKLLKQLNSESLQRAHHLPGAHNKH